MNSSRQSFRFSGTARHLETAVAGSWAIILFLALSLLLCGPVFASGIILRNDLFVGVWSPFGTRWEAKTPVCIWSEQPGESFRITASGQYPGTGFRLLSDSEDSVGYGVRWFPNTVGRNGTRLRSGLSSSSSIVADSNVECGGGANSSIRIRVFRKQIERAAPGIYGDTLLVVLSPL